jgi:hypothetical protein
MSLTASLSQNPDSPYGEPQAGQTRHFDLDTSGPVPKVKNSSADFGKPYKIEEVEQKPDWTSERLGKTFKQWNLVLTPQDGAGNGVSKGSAPASSNQEQIQWGLALKLATWSLNGENNTPNYTAADVKARAQEFFPIVVDGPTNEPDPTPAETSDDDIPF